MASPSSGSPLQSPCPQASSPVPPVWTREEEKVFETALVSLDLGSPDCWQGLTAVLPGKDAASLKNHFDALVEDVESIEAGLIALPAYPDTEELPGGGESSRGKKESHPRVGQVVAGAAAVSIGSGSGKGPSSKSSEIERRKGIPWTEEEHKSFLLGLAKFGKGDWRSISRNFVRTRTPTQVASHAQKYFIRLNSIKKDRRRSSIHDITSVNGDAAQSGQGPITGQGITGHSSSSASGLSEGPVFGAAVGQPISGSLGSTVGTPVMIPSTGFTGPYVSGAPLPRPLIPGAPVGVMQVPYSLTQPVSQPPQQVGRL